MIRHCEHVKANGHFCGSPAMRDRNYGWTIEMQIKALRHKLRVVEVSVSYRRRVGVSKISGNWRASIAAGTEIIWTAFRLMAAR